MKKKTPIYEPETMEQRIERKVKYYTRAVMVDGQERTLRLLLTVIEELKSGKCAYPRCPFNAKDFLK